MKWSILGAVLGFLLIVGGFFSLRGDESRPSTEVTQEPMDIVDSARWGPWLRNGRWAPVHGHTASMLLHCGKASICQGSVLVEEKRTGRLLGAGDYDMRPGTDTRVRVRVPDLPASTKVFLTFRESNGTIGWRDLTFRRR